ncbi:hypothetical protein Golob_009606 [Gossypium lobatum]|uniref:Uncharacterized protein n=1 Tax=Gossypium lobatum TaxID=34289 RepID=A0A7J8MJ05_9ROSI|nr:hypothetical protein [Gossypium lobatum]
MSDNYLSQYTNYYGNKVTENGLISLRFLNKACVIKNPQQDLTSDGNASNPWSLLYNRSSGRAESVNQSDTGLVYGIIIAVTYSLDSFAVIQASTMDRHITPKFDIPAAMVSLTVVEYIRREIAIQEGLSDKPQAMVHISALWILPYAIMSGWASDFNGIGQRILLL